MQRGAIQKAVQVNITSPANPVIKNLVRLREEPRYRAGQHSVLVTDRKVVTDMHASLKVKRVFLPPTGSVPPVLAPQNPEIIRVSVPVLAKACGLQSTDENTLAAEVAMPPFISFADLVANSKKQKRRPFILALDRVSDPGNVGSLLRSALAFGFSSAFFTGGCDPFNDKALRASKGAPFSQSLLRGTHEDIIAAIKEHNFLTYVASPHGKRAFQVKREITEEHGGLVLFVSNEAKGVTEAIKNCSFATLKIPCWNDQIESINVSVAGGILMYDLKRANG